MTAPVRRAPLAAQAAELILGRIRDGEWALGHRLPPESALATRLGVGRSTVREAIRELAGRGVLESRQGSGVFVTALDAEEDWDQVLRRVSIVAVLEARVAIEAESAALAARRRTPADVRALRAALAARAVPDRALEEHVDADMALHRAVVAAAHNEVLTELFDAFVPRVRRAMVELLRARPLPSPGADHDAHVALVDAVVARDATRAAELSRTHLASLREVLA